MANRSVEAISRGGAALCTSASAPHGAGETARSGGDRIVARPGTRHHRGLTDYRPFTHRPVDSVVGTAVPDRTCRTPVRDGRLPSDARDPLLLGGALTQAPGAVEVSLTPTRTHALRSVVCPAGWARLGAALEASRAELQGRTVWMINSTAVGGGVAELLRATVPYWLGTDLDARWAVVQAGPGFFRITKRIHNLLHGHAGDGGELGGREHRVYESSLAPNAAWLERRVRAGDVVVLHDPQTAGLAPALKAMGATVVFRSHVGADHPMRSSRRPGTSCCRTSPTRTRPFSRATPAPRHGWRAPG